MVSTQAQRDYFRQEELKTSSSETCCGSSALPGHQKHSCHLHTTTDMDQERGNAQFRPKVSPLPAGDHKLTEFSTQSCIQLKPKPRKRQKAEPDLHSSKVHYFSKTFCLFSFVSDQGKKRIPSLCHSA